MDPALDGRGLPVLRWEGIRQLGFDGTGDECGNDRIEAVVALLEPLPIVARHDEPRQLRQQDRHELAQRVGVSGESALVAAVRESPPAQRGGRIDLDSEALAGSVDPLWRR